MASSLRRLVGTDITRQENHRRKSELTSSTIFYSAFKGSIYIVAQLGSPPVYVRFLVGSTDSLQNHRPPRTYQ